MEPFLRDINCSVLSANIRPDSTLASTFGAAFQPYKIFDVGGQRVGVVGYTSRETPALSQPGKKPRSHLHGDRAGSVQRFWSALCLPEQEVVQGWFHLSASIRTSPGVPGRGQRPAAHRGQAGDAGGQQGHRSGSLWHRR